MSQQQTIHVDAFDTQLHGAKILCQGPFSPNALPPLIDIVQNHRDPFKKRVLLTKAAFSLCKTLSLNYDAIFQMSDMNDWTLALTYITHCPKPALIIVDDVNIPDAIWSRLTKSITLIHITSTPIRSPTPYDAVFFAPIQDIGSSYSEFVFRQIQALFRSSYTQKEYRDILTELRVAGAGLAWSRWDETNTSGSIYWYDTISQQGSDILSKKQLSDIFLWLNAQFQE
jgi:hypothetical protein